MLCPLLGESFCPYLPGDFSRLAKAPTLHSGMNHNLIQFPTKPCIQILLFSLFTWASLCMCVLTLTLEVPLQRSQICTRSSPRGTVQ